MCASAAKGKKRVRFELAGEAGAQVFVAGTFNDWSATRTPMKYKAGVYSASVLVPPGRYEYKFIVDGVWTVDPECREWNTNDFGTLNSVVQVG